MQVFRNRQAGDGAARPHGVEVQDVGRHVRIHLEDLVELALRTPGARSHERRRRWRACTRACGGAAHHLEEQQRVPVPGLELPPASRAQWLCSH